MWTSFERYAIPAIEGLSTVGGGRRLFSNDCYRLVELVATIAVMPELAVIFDMDGVLVDSYHAHFASWRRLYGELGIDYDEAAFAADFGRTSRDIFAARWATI